VLEITVAVASLGSKSVSYEIEFFLKGERIASGRLSSVCCRVDPGEHRIESMEIPAGIRARLEIPTQLP
jgi:acyl-CoA thioesterase FadM